MEDRHKKIQSIGIIIGLLLSFINLGLFYYLNSNANRLHEAQVNIQENITKIQNKIFQMTSFNTTIFGGERFVYLESYHFQKNKNGTLEYIILRGNFSSTITILTPHFGRFKILIKNFTLHKSIMFEEGMEEYTEVSFVHKPEYYFIYQVGLNNFDLDLPLACLMHPNLELLQPPGESKEFILGIIIFELIFYDAQIPTNVIRYGFTTGVIGIINMPIS